MPTAAAAAPSPVEAPAAPAASTEFSIEIVERLELAESAWREFQRRALMTPYGRFEWVAAFARNVPGATRAALVRNRAGRVALLLPFAVERKLHCIIGSAVGGRHANLTLPLVSPELADELTPGGARQLLRQLGRAAHLDLLTLPNMPVTWRGRPNPFAAGGRPSPNDIWSLHLGPDPEAALSRSMSAESRKKLRKKMSALEKLGPVSIVEGGDPESVDRLLGAFFAQKASRLAELGIPNLFTDEGTRRFLRDAALAGLSAERPAIELYGLAVGDRIIAVFGGAADPFRFSGMFVSFESGPFARYSPGELIVVAAVRRQAARGRQVVDFGVGEARFKRSICDTTERLVDVSVAVTAKGRIFGETRSGLVDLKGRIKRSPHAMAGVARLRRGLAKLRG